MASAYPGRRVRFLIGDRGYDALTNYQALDCRKILAVIGLRDTDRSSGFTLRGEPSCLGGKVMEYVKTVDRREHVFRCSPGGCELRDARPWLGRRCPQEYSVDWEEDRLRKIGRLPRASRRWRRLYRKRTEIERMFGNLKQSRLLDSHQYMGLAKVSLHVGLSMLTFVATMLAHLRRDDHATMREMVLEPPVSFSWVLPVAA